jgi:hypothetical protein
VIDILWVRYTTMKPTGKRGSRARSKRWRSANCDENRGLGRLGFVAEGGFCMMKAE